MINWFNKVSVVLLFSLSGCLVEDRSPRYLNLSDSFAKPQYTIEQFKFERLPSHAQFVSADGAELWQFVRSQNLAREDSIILSPSSHAIETAKLIKDFWAKNGEQKLQILPSERRERTDNPTIVVEIRGTALILNSCVDAAGRYRLGCAVRSNRALSLTDYNELVSGGNLGTSPAVLERRPIKRVIEGKSVPLIEAKE